MKTRYISRSIIYLVIILLFYSVALLFIIPFFINLNSQTYSLLVGSFNKIAIGIGALTAGLAGLQYLDLLEKGNAEDRIKKYREKFPLDQFGSYFDEDKKYFLARNDDGGDEIYIAERLKTKDKLKRFKFYHIGNRYTFRDLFVGTGLTGKIQSLMNNYFEACDFGEPVLTRGEVGE